MDLANLSLQLMPKRLSSEAQDHFRENVTITFDVEKILQNLMNKWYMKQRNNFEFEMAVKEVQDKMLFKSLNLGGHHNPVSYRNRNC